MCKVAFVFDFVYGATALNSQYRKYLNNNEYLDAD
jgi:hypothetical protein